MKKYLALLLLAITFQGFAQTYPITGINISLPSNPDANIAEWSKSMPPFMISAQTRMENGKVSPMVMESSILVSIKGNGAVCGHYSIDNAPSSNFNSPAKVWSGETALNLLGEACVLKPGNYEFCVKFYGNGAVGQVLIGESCKSFTIKETEHKTYQPPMVLAPANGTELSESDLIKPITFRWTPLVPKPQEPVTYRLKVWQLMQGQSGTQTMKSNQPIITKDIDNLTQTTVNNLLTGPCKPPYLCDFIWNVQALNREGKPIGGNNGTSETLTFSSKVTEETIAPPTLKLPANGETIATGKQPLFTWLPPTPVPPGVVTYKIKIVEIVGDESPENTLRTNKPFFEKDSIELLNFQYPSSARAFEAGKKYAWGVSIFDRWGNLKWSNVASFYAASCDVNLSLRLNSVTCVSSADQNAVYKICVSATYTSANYNLTYLNSGSGFKSYHPTYTPSYTVNNVSSPLQTQNSGSSTTVDYCLEVIVPVGQTTIKLGLQGDDKDSGPITCQPGAELDIRLPNCPIPPPDVCDCGTWSPLSIQNAAGTQRYDCGKEINWNCKTSFDFKSSFQCKSNDKSCEAKIKWEVTKDGVPYKSGSGTNTISEGFTPNGNGTYVLTLNADCNGKSCPPCTYTIIVRDCESSCDCGTWSPLSIQNAAGTQRYDCGKEINWNCKTSFDFKSSFQCKSNDKSCEAKIKWEVTKDGVPYKSGSGTNTISEGFTPNGNGTYVLTLNADCNGKSCPPCTYTIIVRDCESSCDCGTWSPLSIQNAAGTQRYDCGKEINWNCKTSFDFKSSFQCKSNDKSCEAKIKWEVTKDGVPYKSGSGTNTISEGFTPNGNGTYVLTLNADCNGKSCPPCTYTIIVRDCESPDPCLPLCNSSFEQFLNITPPSGFIQTIQDNIPCWKTTASDNKIEIWKDGYGNVPAYSGLYFAELNATQVGTLYQTFSVTSPKTLIVSFAHRGRYSGIDKMKVSIVAPNGTVTALGGYSDNNSAWKYYTTPSYLCNAIGTYTLRFESISSNGGSGPANGGNFLDSISVTCAEIPPPLNNCVIPPSGLVLWLPGDGNTNDISGLNNHGTIHGGLSYVSGKVAQTFNVSNSADYISVSDNSSLNFGKGNFSIDAWVKTSDNMNALIIASKFVITTGSNVISSGYLFSSESGKLGFYMGDGSASALHAVSTNQIADGLWHFVAVTVDRKITTGGKLYIDGNLVLTFNPTTKPNSITNTSLMVIAKSNITSVNKGQIDEVEIFNRILTQEEITSIFKAGSAGKCKPIEQHVCDCGTCGTWGSLSVQNTTGSSIKYECGKEIVGSCNKKFDFRSSYQCKPNNAACVANTKWTVIKDGVTIGTGSGLIGSFTPTSNGVYSITLNVDCNGKACTPCIYTIVVEDCLSCSTDIISNGNFVQGNQPGSMPSLGAVQSWYMGYGSPIVNNDPLEGFIEQGYVKLSGNVANGHAISQEFLANKKIVSGKKYRVSVAVRFISTQNAIDYAKIRIIAFNGTLSTSGNHPPPSTNVAIIGRSGKIRDCNDWSVIEFPIWTANKDFSNIAINAFTNDNSNATVLIDNITICETNEGDCDEVPLDSNNNPIIPAGYGDVPPGFPCQPEAEEEEYYNGSLQDLYPGYNGTTDLYSQTTNSCFSIGGTLPPEVDSYDCDAELKAAGIEMTCEELQALLDQPFEPTEIKKSILPPIPAIVDKNCDRPGPKNIENMPFRGKDIIYIHGLQMDHIIDRAAGYNGARGNATGNWPSNANEYYMGGYYNIVAYNNMLPHIDHFLRSRGNLNRFLIVSYDCSQSAEVAVHAVLSQIREAMENGIGVQTDPSDLRGKNCFAKDYIMISHSTGALVADVALSIANKTKTDINLKTQYGDIGLISDRCKGRVSIQGAYSGSNLAKIAVLGAQAFPTLFSTVITALSFAPLSTQTITSLNNSSQIIANSILVDLVPSITYARWGSYINQINVPVFTLSGGHPSAILGPLKYSILSGFDDGVLSMDGANANNNAPLLGLSRFSADAIKVFDMGIPKLRAIKYYLDQRVSQGVFAAASTAYLSPTGMVQPVSSIIVEPQNHFNNHYSFVQSSKEHWFATTEPSSGNTPCDYKETSLGAATNNEEQLVVTKSSLFTPGLIDPAIISQMGETLKDRHISYPWIKIVIRHGIPRPSVYWKQFYIWKRTYHKLIDNCMYDVDYAYKYLFKQ
ncbi:MAG: LamG domain-containing protein [Lutibacter sp.]